MRQAFTLIELIMVIVIVGVLSMIAASSFPEEDELRLAQEQIIRHIKLTQHLAIMNDMFDPSDRWWICKR